MAQSSITPDEVDIVIGALQPDLTSFMNSWNSIFSNFHLIIVKDPDLSEELKIPEGFDVNVYTKSDMDKLVGASLTTRFFSGISCRYFGYLISNKKYIIAIDDDCVPAKDKNGLLTDAIAQHMKNLGTPAIPRLFNPHKGLDIDRGYPISMRDGVDCALSCGLWSNFVHYDSDSADKRSRYEDAVVTVPTNLMMPVSGINDGVNRQLLGPAIFPGIIKLSDERKNRWETVENYIWRGLGLNFVHYDSDSADKRSRYVDDVVSVPTNLMMSVSGINIGVNRQMLGPAIFPGVIKLSDEGKKRWETVEDNIWCGMCVKAICEHLGFGVKNGIPYVWRNEMSDAELSSKKEWFRVKLMEEVHPFFKSLELTVKSGMPEDCLLEIASQAKEKLGKTNAIFIEAADAMVDWVNLWKKVAHPQIEEFTHLER